jgi:hypothetical protein
MHVATMIGVLIIIYPSISLLVYMKMAKFSLLIFFNAYDKVPVWIASLNRIERLSFLFENSSMNLDVRE